MPAPAFIACFNLTVALTLLAAPTCIGGDDQALRGDTEAGAENASVASTGRDGAGRSDRGAVDGVKKRRRRHFGML